MWAELDEVKQEKARLDKRQDQMELALGCSHLTHLSAMGLHRCLTSRRAETHRSFARQLSSCQGHSTFSRLATLLQQQGLLTEEVTPEQLAATLDAIVGPWHARAHMNTPLSLDTQTSDTAELLHMNPTLVDQHPANAMVILGWSIFMDLYT